MSPWSFTKSFKGPFNCVHCILKFIVSERNGWCDMAGGKCICSCDIERRTIAQVVRRKLVLDSAISCRNFSVLRPMCQQCEWQVQLRGCGRILFLLRDTSWLLHPEYRINKNGPSSPAFFSVSLFHLKGTVFSTLTNYRKKKRGLVDFWWRFLLSPHLEKNHFLHINIS